MKNFNSLLKSKYPRSNDFSHLEKLYKEQKAIGSIIDYKNLETLNIKDLFQYPLSKKFDQNLIFLWGLLEMQTFLDFVLGNTINPYLLTKKNNLLIVKDLPDYDSFEDEQKFQHLLDIKYVKQMEFEGITFNNIYIAIFEILDKNYEYRPFVTISTKNEDGNFFRNGYGYDTNDNGNVELFIPSFNYPIFMTPQGHLINPLSGKKVKINVYDYITIDEVKKIYQSVKE